MMKAMRKMTKSILWIVIAAFVGTIVFAWGMQFTARKSKQGVIGVINGKDISFQNFQYLYEEKLREAQKGEEEVTDEVAKSIKDKAWSELIDQYLLAQEVKKRGIVITDRELYEFMKRFPPKEIMEAEVFQTDGKFDYNKYRQALSDRRFPWGQIEGYVKGQLTIAKLQETIIGAVRVTDQQVYRDYVDNTQKVRVNYLLIPMQEFSGAEVEISPKELEEYYKQHAKRYEMVERAILKYVEFPKTPSKEDEEKTKARLLEIREMILKGEDFGEMAKEYSEDQVNKNSGGDLGWLKRGATRESFDKALFALKPGELSEPVRTEVSWHLIKLLEKRKVKGEEEVHASHIALKINPSEEALNRVKSAADEFVLKARKIGLEKAAAEDKLTVKESGMFIKGSIIPNLGVSPEANRFAFEEKPDKISDPIETPIFFFVAQLKEKRPAGIPQLSEVEVYVRQALLGEKQSELAYQKGRKIYEEVLKGKEFKKVALEYKEKVMENYEFTRNASIPTVGENPEFIGTAFALKEKNQVSPPIKTYQGTYLIQLIFKTEVDENLYQSQLDSLKLNLLRKKQYDFYTQWFDNLRKNAKVEDFRDQYYKEVF